MVNVVVDINHEAGDWFKGTPDLEPLILRALKGGLAAVDMADQHEVEISILLTDDAHQRVLNATWRKLDKSTNVLSFPSGEETAQPGQPLPLGDIALAFETVHIEAQDQQKSVADHMSHLLVHGVLHLLGFDHETSDDAHKMESLEIEILDGMGLSSPYADRS